MKAIIIIIYYCMALLPPIIHGVRSSINSNMNPASDYSNDDSTCSTATSSEWEPADDFPTLRADVNTFIIHPYHLINGVFKPLEYFMETDLSLVYKGNLTMANGLTKTVAMKFTPFKPGQKSPELGSYQLLGANGNSTTEKYGISTVYYRGKWKNYFMVGITLHDPEFRNKAMGEDGLVDEAFQRIPDLYQSLEYYHICLEFILALKYIHSHGICHDYIDKLKLMFRSNRGFIIDFDFSYRVNEVCRNDDLFSLMKALDSLWAVNLDFSNQHRLSDSIRRLQNEALKTIFTLFERNGRQGVRIDYDGMYRAFAAKIQGLGHEGPFIFSWMNEEQWNDLMDGSPPLWEQNQHPQIDSILDPYR